MTRRYADFGRLSISCSQRLWFAFDGMINGRGLAKVQRFKVLPTEAVVGTAHSPTAAFCCRLR